MAKQFLVIGSLSAFLGIALGAFGAHMLKDKLAEKMFSAYQTGVLYHLVHALALLITGVIAKTILPTPLVHWSGWCFLAGTLLFSGSLYIMSISGIRAFGAITPIGGLAFMAGWLLLAFAVIRQMD